MFLTKRITCLALVLAMTAVVKATADDSGSRLTTAAAVLDKLTGSPGHGISPEQLAKADCVAVIPGFKKGAAGVGIGFGKGFISCRNGDSWSAPGAITLETASVGVQLGGEKIDIVILSLDKDLRSKLLSDRFTVGADASAAWVNGKSAHDDTNAKILFFGQTKGTFAGFGLDGANLKADESSNKALYGKPMSNSAIVGGQTDTPTVAQPLIEKLTEETSR